MRNFILAVIVSLANAGADWKISFTPHELNVGLSVVTDCTLKGKLSYKSVNFLDVVSTWKEVVIPRITRGIPNGSSCTTRFEVMRNADGGQGDPDNDYNPPGEATEITWIEQ